MTIYRQPNAQEPVGETVPLDDKFGYCREGEAGIQGTFDTEEAAMKALVQDAGCSASFFIDGSAMEMRLQ